ncbi:HigA family addiction module antitoxin [Pseudomonas violetae]|jgi:antitoxin HigA-1|uniref:HigA family addiction module antitoxin n=1 Tax=Pseudomonas violetae TaxID=2915813 RepID=A0ABT0EXF5_9PSED|nr:HigA family addiction module antitoxin [Pseudomonas violetae]MCK1790136.1 HigA family addiction module antitoxin [Pseudomonas violetae]
MDSNGMRSIHSGETLEQDSLEPLGATGADLAGQHPDYEVELTKLVAQSTGVSPDLARKLAVHFNTTPDFWLNLQSHYEARSDDIERG